MSRQRNTTIDNPEPFGAQRVIEEVALDSVTGGRTVSATSGTDPALLQGIQGLVKAVGSINDSLSSAKKQTEQQAMQFVMQMIQGK